MGYQWGAGSVGPTVSAQRSEVGLFVPFFFNFPILGFQFPILITFIFNKLFSNRVQAVSQSNCTNKDPTCMQYLLLYLYVFIDKIHEMNNHQNKF
jgi:hypothetical protein